jgi:SAM-dependent methyltransferase
VEQLIRRLAERPEPFAPGDVPLWSDPYIAGRMLPVHLDPSTDLASRRPETIAREVDWLARTLGLEPGNRLLDLGCGPGLYCAALAARGLDVTGIDISAGSLEHARRAAADAGLSIRYLQADYRTLDEHDAYDVAMLVYLDFGTYPERDRDTLLAGIRDALRPGGRFVFDVVSGAAARPEQMSWTAHPGGGFWRPGPHLVLLRQLDYPELELSCDEHTVVEATGDATVFRVWEQRFSREAIGRMLGDAGFEVEHIGADLTGTAWSSEAETLAVVARRR